MIKQEKNTTSIVLYSTTLISLLKMIVLFIIVMKGREPESVHWVRDIRISGEIRDRLLEFQKIQKFWNTQFSYTLKPVEHDGKNCFSKY